jgi:multidrug efflux pump subunit AcrB
MALDADRAGVDPTSILTSLAVLAALGETVNVMTLGGLALAVGILVDDATVAIENTYRCWKKARNFVRRWCMVRLASRSLH